MRASCDTKEKLFSIFYDLKYFFNNLNCFHISLHEICCLFIISFEEFYSFLNWALNKLLSLPFVNRNYLQRCWNKTAVEYFPAEQLIFLSFAKLFVPASNCFLWASICFLLTSFARHPIKQCKTKASAPINLLHTSTTTSTNIYLVCLCQPHVCLFQTPFDMYWIIRHKNPSSNLWFFLLNFYLSFYVCFF